MGRDVEEEGQAATPEVASESKHNGDGGSGGDREQYRRYGKKRSSVGSILTQEARFSPSGRGQSPSFRDSFSSPAPRELWQENQYSGVDFQSPIATDRKGRGSQKLSPSKEELARWGLSNEGMQGFPEMETKPLASVPKASAVLRTVKQEPGLGEELLDSAEESYGRFAFMLHAALQGDSSFPELMEQFESSCHDLAQLVREEATERHRVTEERLMRQTAQMLQGEAGSWSLLWHLFGKGAEDMYSDDAFVSPSTSQQEASLFIAGDPTAQQCLRIVQWLESSSSKDLDYQEKHKGWYAGSYVQKLGVWHQTQRAIRKRAGQATLVRHLDPDAPTREHARLHSEDQKLEEDLLEDVWKLLRAGRLEEARQLCRSAGQPWRAASLGGCGELGPSPPVEAYRDAGKDRGLQALELESGHGHQRRLWKWACFCASEKIGQNADEGRHEAAVYAAQCGNIKRMLPVCFDWESACWAMARSWLDTQVDSELLQRHPPNPRMSKAKGGRPGTTDGGEGDMSMKILEGPHSWPQPVLEQQPHDLVALFQKLHSGDLVHESVQRSCKEQQRLVQMDLMVGDFPHLLDLLKEWTVPRESKLRHHGHPQMVRFGAHVVLVLRRILADTVDETTKEKLGLIGDLILSAYVIFLFKENREELVGVYASQLAPHLCVELYVNFMDLRQNDSVPVKYKIFLSAVEFLPLFPDNGRKGSVSDILDKVLSKSREIKAGLQQPVKEEGPGDLRQLESSQKAQAVQWLCFTAPPSVPDAERLQAELLARALEHSNLLFREFALISLWRTAMVPAGPHKLLSYLAEPLKHPTEMLFSLDQPHRVQENLQEFKDWRNYYECDALYRGWLKVEQSNAEVPPEHLSAEEKERAITAAKEALEHSLSLLHQNKGSWLAGSDNTAATEPQLASVEWLELQATAVLMSASGSYLPPEATVCTTLSSALYHCGGESGVQRQLTVEVDKNIQDGSCVDIRLRCIPVKGDGVGPATRHNGGLLGSILALAAKGELPHFKSGLALEVVTMDSWYWDESFLQQEPALYILQGLCRQCCLPELILRCMQLRVFLAGSGDGLEEDEESDLIGLVAAKETALHHLFSHTQLQEFLLLEREVTICNMEAREDGSQF